MKKEPIHPIAVIGYGCVYPPNGYNADEFWDIIVSGRSGIRVAPENRWRWEYYYDADRSAEDKTYCRFGGYVEDYNFPYHQYQLNPENFCHLNRTQLMLLDTILQAMTQAKIDFNQLKGEQLGIFIGNMLGDELFLQYSLNYRANEFLYYLETNETFKKLSKSQQNKVKKEFLATVKDKFPQLEQYQWEKALHSSLGKSIRDLFGNIGPTMIVDAACGGGIIVIDEAIKWLQTKRIKTCVVSGVLGNMGVTGNVAFAKIGGLSPTHSSPLDIKANGLIPGEGAGTIILKRLDQAIKDGDQIQIVIRSVGVASDGKGKSIYAPSSKGQVMAMRNSLQKVGLKPSDLDYIEAHATATLVGDIVEVNTLKMLFEQEDLPKNSIGIGSVKSQIGHTFSAAGIANLIKVLQGMKHNQLPPTHNYTASPSELEIEKSPLYVNSQLKEWPVRKAGEPKRAAVNAFGFGGINGSTLVEEYHAEYHQQLLNIKDSQESSELEMDVAIVGIGCLDSHGIGKEAWWQGITNSPKLNYKYPESRWNQEINEIYQNKDQEVVGSFIEDFKFPWMKFKIPPTILPQIDKSQQMALWAASEAIEEYGVERIKGEKTGIFVGAMFGLESSILSALRISFIEYIKIIKEIKEFKGLSETLQETIINDLTNKFRSYIPMIAEDTLPGYMDNIIAGRIANYFDINGANLVIDSDSSSFMAALEQGIISLQQGDYETIIVGGVHANMSPEFLEIFKTIKKSTAQNCPHCGTEISELIPAEGAVFMILKNYAAVTKEEQVYARIKGICHESELLTPSSTLSKMLTVQNNQNIIDLEKVNYYQCCKSFKNETTKVPFYFGANAGFTMLKSILALHHNQLDHLKETPANQSEYEKLVGISSFSILGGDYLLLLDSKESSEKVKESTLESSTENILMLGAASWQEMNYKINNLLEFKKAISDSQADLLKSEYRMVVMYKNVDELMRKLKLVV